MPQFDRTSGHRSQPRGVVHKGELSPEQLTDGVPVFSETDYGVVQYLKINGVVYKNFMQKSEGEGGDADVSDSGFVRLPGGMLMQWGVVGKPGHTSGYLSTTAKVNFPVTFPNKVLSVVATYVHADPTDTGGLGDINATIVAGESYALSVAGQIAMRHPVKTTGVTFTTDTGADAFYWIAIGF
tara:strand:- start:207 stop:755 length:549 start_codon:yes stop_codon:yes gene_type:complete